MIQRVSEILKDLKGKASAKAALLTSSDGLVLGAVQDEGIELESLAAYAASNMMTSERMGESVDSGMPESVLVIYQDSAVVMAPVGPVVAILIGSSVTQLGNLRLQLKRAMVDLTAALQDELDLKTESQSAPAKAPELFVEENAVPKPAPQVQKTSVDPEPNGNGHKGAPPARRGSPVNLK